MRSNHENNETYLSCFFLLILFHAAGQTENCVCMLGSNHFNFHNAFSVHNVINDLHETETNSEKSISLFGQLNGMNCASYNFSFHFLLLFFCKVLG